MLVVLHFAVCYSPHVSEKKKDRTYHVHVFGERGERRQWLVHELESALVVICGELQSKHFIGGGGACAKYF